MKLAIQWIGLAVLCLFSAGLAFGGSGISLTPTTVSFGNQALGVASAAVTLTLSNAQSTAVTITSITTTAKDFTNTTSCPLSPQQLKANTSCTISAVFTPSTLSTNIAMLSVIDDASNSPQTSILSGTGIQDVTVSAVSLAFGNQATGHKSAGQSITVTNNQTAAVKFNSITTTLTDYSLTTTCPLSPKTLSGGGTCTVTVYFTPAVNGLRSGTLTITDNAANSPSVSLSGTGVADAVATPSALTFASQIVGTASLGQAVTLMNNQATAMTITSITISGDYSYTTSCPISPSTLAAGASCLATVTFTPTVAGTRTGVLTFNDSAGNSPQTVTLTGTATTLTLSSISVSPKTSAIAPAGTQQFTAIGTYSDGSTANLTSSATWTSSAKTTATVSHGGLATAVAVGAATIKATSGAVHGSATLTVTKTPPSLVSVAITPNPSQVKVGKTTQLAATATYSDSSSNDVTYTAAWNTSDATIATVASGALTGVRQGSATVTATLSGIASPAVTTDVGPAADYYVSTLGSDQWSGTLFEPNASLSDGPYATIGKAQTAVRAILANPQGRTAAVNVLIRGGNYYQQALSFSSADSGSATLAVNWQNYPNEIPAISGGMLVTGWTATGGNTFQATLPSGAANFENLFYNGQRRLRPRAGAGLGNYLRIAAPVFLQGSPPPSPAPDPNCMAYIAGSGWECFDRFQFAAGDISASWSNLNPPFPQGDIELVDFEWWTVPKMRIKSVDGPNHIVYMTGPLKQQLLVHGFIQNHRYLVENIKDNLNQAGQWFLDRSATPWKLAYLAKSNEYPPTDTVVVPQSAQVLVATGLQYVTFQGLTFEHDDYVVPSTGYVSLQQEVGIPGAVVCNNCLHVTFDSDIIAETAGSGIELKTTDASKTTAYNAFQNGALYDIGGIGIRVGLSPSITDTDANVTQFTTIQNNLIEGFARVFPSAVGIVQGSGHDNLYTHNAIYDGYHSGIEICVPPACAPGTSGSKGSFNNVVSFNHVHDLFQGVTDDGGAIYFATGGSSFTPAGNQALNNKVHDTSDASIMDSDGYGGHGIYLDSATGLVDIENNLVYRISGEDVKITNGPQIASQQNTIKNNILAYSHLGMVSNTAPYANNVCPSSPVKNFDATNNLFYFDRSGSVSFYVQQGCVYSCGFPLTDLHNWQSNLYWRVDGLFSADTQAFHTQPNAGRGTLCSGSPSYSTFSGWQGIGEDAASTATQDPGFNNPGYPNDDFSLPGGSPGVGFVVFDATQAGRVNPVIKPTDPMDIPATFPTATYNKATDY